MDEEKSRLKIHFMKTHEHAKLPTKGTKHAAAFDLYACEKATLEPHDNEKINIGLAMEIPRGYYGKIEDRSGWAFKRNIVSQAGIIDSDYRGTLYVSLQNNSNENVKVKIGDRVAQIIILPYPLCEFVEVEKISSTKRGKGGFGSTGF